MWRKSGATRVSATMGSASASSGLAHGSANCSITRPAWQMSSTQLLRVRWELLVSEGLMAHGQNQDRSNTHGTMTPAFFQPAAASVQ